jgi:hypothetical protein
MPLGASVRIAQRGELRTGTRSRLWMPFEATHEARAGMPAFSWNAKVRLAPFVHLQVRDRLEGGVGSGEVCLFGVRMARDAGTMQMHSGALHRYLAEAVWYPWALRPSSFLRWSAVDARSALATLEDRGVSVSLEFRFDAEGDVAAIYTPARWGKFGRGYRQLPWEGHFRGYVERAGVRVPGEGDVGWHVEGEWQAVWRGHIVEWRAQ